MWFYCGSADFSCYSWPHISYTGSPSSSCEIIILRNNSHGEIMRITTALRNKKNVKFLQKKHHLTSTVHCLLSDCLLRWREPIFRGFLRTWEKGFSHVLAEAACGFILSQSALWNQADQKDNDIWKPNSSRETYEHVHNMKASTVSPEPCSFSILSFNYLNKNHRSRDRGE